MLTKIGALTAILGFLTFMGMTFAMVSEPHTGPAFTWPLTSALCVMTGGLVVAGFTLSRQDRQEVLARLIADIHG